MKNMDKFKQLKNDYPDMIVIIKSGIFYVSYEEDAKILNYILGYNYLNGKVGFPLKNKDYAIKALISCGLSLVISEEDVEVYKSNKNSYYEILEKALKKVNEKQKLQELYKIIEIKTRQYPDSFDLIMEFVNEL